MRIILAEVMLFVAVTAMGAQTSPPDAPLPSVQQLRERALAGLKKSDEARERYLCREAMQTDDLDGNGNVKKTETFERELFFVHGHQITQTVTENGKPISAEAEKKQLERVKKEIAEDSAAEPPKAKSSDIKVSDILRLSKLTNERRTMMSGRGTIVFDASGDPAARADTIEEKAIQAMEGTIAIDEETGTPKEIDMHGARDVSVGGGLVAKLTKGFSMHVVLAPQPDGV
jgi:hypothetical protein